MENKTIQPKKIIVKDAHLDDEKIPRNLIIMYDKTPYITKAGLEWKAMKLYGIDGYSVNTKLITTDFEKNIFVVKATFINRITNTQFVNYGEARTVNANSMMQKQLFHLAITRAECRVLRMATACGYASYDEVLTMNGDRKQIGQLTDGDQPATQEQIDTLAKMNFIVAQQVDKDSVFTKQMAADKIAELLEAKK